MTRRPTRTKSRYRHEDLDAFREEDVDEVVLNVAGVLTKVEYRAAPTELETILEEVAP